MTDKLTERPAAPPPATYGNWLVAKLEADAEHDPALARLAWEPGIPPQDPVPIR